MLLMGMWMSLTKNPMKPMMAKPIAVAIAIFWNSKRQKKTFNFHYLFSNFRHFSIENLDEDKLNALKTFLPLRSGFVHLLTKRRESLAN